VFGIEGQARLRLQEKEDRPHPKQLRECDRPGIGLPAHVLILADAHEAVEAAFDGAEEGMEEGPLPLQDLRHERPEGERQPQKQGQVEEVLGPDVAHWNFSGLSRAKAR
jgi:hypothetical protein